MAVVVHMDTFNRRPTRHTTTSLLSTFRLTISLGPHKALIAKVHKFENATEAGSVKAEIGERNAWVLSVLILFPQAPDINIQYLGQRLIDSDPSLSQSELFDEIGNHRDKQSII